MLSLYQVAIYSTVIVQATQIGSLSPPMVCSSKMVAVKSKSTKMLMFCSLPVLNWIENIHDEYHIVDIFKARKVRVLLTHAHTAANVI